MRFSEYYNTDNDHHIPGRDIIRTLVDHLQWRMLLALSVHIFADRIKSPSKRGFRNSPK